MNGDLQTVYAVFYHWIEELNSGNKFGIYKLFFNIYYLLSMWTKGKNDCSLGNFMKSF